MGCNSSKEKKTKKGIQSALVKKDSKGGGASNKSITFDQQAPPKPPSSPNLKAGTDAIQLSPGTETPTASSNSSRSIGGGHERQKSVTADLKFHHDRQKSVTASLRGERGESVDSEDAPPKTSRLRKKNTSDSHEMRKGSNLQENLISVNSASSNVREFYEGIDDEDRILGSGNWGVVKVVTRKRDGRKYACKIVKLDGKMTDTQFEELRTEIDALRQLDHVSIAKLFETFEEPGLRLYLIMELLTGGELYTALVERSPTGRFDEIRTRRLAKRMVSAIAYLHDKGLVHRDVKLENFCFRGDEEEDEIVLIDFGLAKLYEMKKNMTDVVGSSYYIAPEIVEGSYTGPSPDMWSLGVIFFMMLSGRPPFDGSSDQNIMRRAVKGKFSMEDEVWKSEVSNLAKDFVCRCLTRDPNNRMSSKEGLRHQWLTASDEALIDAGAGDDPARALAPAVIPSVVSENMSSLVRKTSRRISATLFGPGTHDEMLDRLRFFASRHELVRLFSQAVAFSLGRIEVKDLTKLFVNLDRDSDGLITVGDIEVGLLGAPPAEVDEENSKSGKGGSFTILNSSPAAKVSTGKFPGFHTTDEATRFKRKRKREANYLFAAMDVQKKGKVSLNEFIAATLDLNFYKDEKLLTDAFLRLCGANAGDTPEQVIVNLRVMEGMLGSRFTDRRARRLIGEFVALARFATKDLSTPEPEPPAPPPPEKPPTVHSASERLRKFGSSSAKKQLEFDDLDVDNNLSPRRVDVDHIVFTDFVKGMQHAL